MKASVAAALSSASVTASPLPLPPDRPLTRQGAASPPGTPVPARSALSAPSSSRLCLVCLLMPAACPHPRRGRPPLQLALPSRAAGPPAWLGWVTVCCAMLGEGLRPACTLHVRLQGQSSWAASVQGVSHGLAGFHGGLRWEFQVEGMQCLASLWEWQVEGCRLSPGACSGLAA